MFRSIGTALLILLLATVMRGQKTGFQVPVWWPGTAAGLSGDPVLSLAMSPFGEVYIGTTEGLLRWEGRNGVAVSGRDGIPSGQYHYLGFSKDSVLRGWVDSLPFSWDGREFRTDDRSDPWPGYPPKEQRPVLQDSVGRRYTGMANGLMIEYLTGWEQLETPECDMPWSVIVEPGRSTFVLPCHKTGFQRYDKDGQLLQVIPINGSEEFDAFHDSEKGRRNKLQEQDRYGTLSPPKRQLFPGFIQVNDRDILVGGLFGPYKLAGDDPALVIQHSYTTESFAYDSLTGRILFAGRKISAIQAGGEIQNEILDIPWELVSQHSATDMLAERDQIWVTGKLGAGCFHRASEQWELFTPENGRLPSLSPYHIFRTPGGKLLIGLEEGLGIFREEERRFERLFPDMIRQQVGQIMEYRGDTLIVISARRAYFFQEKDTALRLLRVNDQDLGLPLLEFNENGAMIDEENQLYISDFSGVYRYDLSRLNRQLFCRNHLIPERVGEHNLPYKGPLPSSLVHKGRTLQVSFRVVGPEAAVAIPEYRFNGGPWTSAEHPERILIDSIPYGPLTLQLRARIPGMPAGEWPVRSMSVYVNWPFWQYPVFHQVVIFIAIFGSLYVLVYIVLATFERREIRRIERQLAEARNKSIEARLHPGILMKSIQAILAEIEAGDRSMASRQLVHLARLLRKMLDISADSGSEEDRAIASIPLDREIAFLQDMIQLEKNLRPHEFSFILSIDDQEMEENPLIPPLILLPVIYWLFDPDTEAVVRVQTLRLSVEGQPEKLRFKWRAAPVDGTSFDDLKVGFPESEDGRHLLERISLMRKLGVRMELSTEVVGGEYGVLLVLDL